MSLMESLLGVSIVFWSAIFIYILYLDRKVSSLRNRLQTLESEE